jgi:glycosyltransferase involved in cell wall biosynthesis
MVVFSHYEFDPRPRRAAEALANAGMHVDLICLRENSGDSKCAVVKGVNLRRVPIAKRREGVLGYLYQYSAFLFITSAIFAYRSLKKRYDLVYVHNMPDFLALSGLIPKAFGSKVVLDLHDPMPELMRTIFELPPQAMSVRVLKLVERWSIGLVDAVVTVNEACARLFASRSCSPEKISVVMNSPDESIFQSRTPQTRARQARNKPFVIMYHGALVERNGLDLAIEALARVRQSVPNARLHVYGSRNPYLERVMKSARDLGVAEAIEFFGPKPTRHIAEAIEQCDVGIIPNRRNIFTELNTPTRIFEYLALGKPVIAPRAPGICDYFDDKSLIFFELGDAEDLARKIEHVFYRLDEAVEITKRGQEVHQAHSWYHERLRLTGLIAGLLR